MFKVAKLERKL